MIPEMNPEDKQIAMMLALAGTILNEPNGAMVAKALIRSIEMVSVVLAMVAKMQDPERPIMVGVPEDIQEILGDIAKALTESWNEEGIADVITLYKEAEAKYQGDEILRSMPEDFNVSDILGEK
jgi:hypothetical protein